MALIITAFLNAWPGKYVMQKDIQYRKINGVLPTKYSIAIKNDKTNSLSLLFTNIDKAYHMVIRKSLLLVKICIHQEKAPENFFWVHLVPESWYLRSSLYHVYIGTTWSCEWVQSVWPRNITNSVIKKNKSNYVHSKGTHLTSFSAHKLLALMSTFSRNVPPMSNPLTTDAAFSQHYRYV